MWENNFWNLIFFLFVCLFLQQCKYRLFPLLPSLVYYRLFLTKEKWIYQLIIMITWRALSIRDTGQVWKKTHQKKMYLCVFATWSRSCLCCPLRAVAGLRGSVAGQCCVCWPSLLWWMESTKCVWPWSRGPVAQPTGNWEIWPSCHRENFITSLTLTIQACLCLQPNHWAVSCWMMSKLLSHGFSFFMVPALSHTPASAVGWQWVVLAQAACGCQSVPGFGQQRSSPQGKISVCCGWLTALRALIEKSMSICASSSPGRLPARLKSHNEAWSRYLIPHWLCQSDFVAEVIPYFSPLLCIFPGAQMFLLSMECDLNCFNAVCGTEHFLHHLSADWYAVWTSQAMPQSVKSNEGCRFFTHVFRTIIHLCSSFFSIFPSLAYLQFTHIII